MKGETNTWLKHGDTPVKQADMQGAVVGYKNYTLYLLALATLLFFPLFLLLHPYLCLSKS